MTPVEIDGCALVILQDSGWSGFHVLESGVLSYDGCELSLERTDGTRRPMGEQEQRKILNVTGGNRIPECAGFDLFILRSSPTNT